MLKTLLIASISIGLAGIIALVAIYFIERNNQNTMAQYKQDYQAALQQQVGSESGIDLGIDNFRQTFANLADPETDRHVSQLYAADVYFNDTVVTIRDHAKLVDYMRETSKKVNSSDVEVQQVIRDGADVFVRWTMHFKSSAYGIKVDSDTIGMTHLRFNDEGKVILHQDFWDSTAGIYSHLPIVGFFVRRAQALMH